MICTFFGHSDTPETIKPMLKATITEVIEKENVTDFYVGNHGNFDRMAISILSELAKTRSIRFYVVLAYQPTEKDVDYLAHTVLPDGIETVPPRFTINYRNRFMLENADFVITYVTHSWGGAAKFKQMAEKKHKRMDRLAELLNISNTQRSFMENVGPGQGLLKVGSSLVPFVNQFPTNTSLYKLMSTKINE